MDSDIQEINAMLLTMRDGIRLIRPGPDRDRMQNRFDRMLKRMSEVPTRVLAAYDQRGIRDGPELARVWRVEMERALSTWEHDA
jgi:hypothetical protein